MSVNTSLQSRLTAAMEHQKAGRLDQAEAIYQSILDEDPDQPDAIHLLGLIRMEQDRDLEAVEMMERCIRESETGWYCTDSYSTMTRLLSSKWRILHYSTNNYCRQQ